MNITNRMKLLEQQLNSVETADELMTIFNQIRIIEKLGSINEQQKPIKTKKRRKEKCLT